MAIKIKELIKKLKDKDQDAEVEFIVVETNGMLVCIDVEALSKNMRRLLQMFNN